MKHLFATVLAGMFGLALTGCEWSGGGGDSGGSWSSRYNFVNFSGSYRGSPLVSEYSATSGGGTTDSGESYVNQSESQTRNVQLQTVISGKLSYSPVVPSSVQISASGTLTSGANSYNVGFSVVDDGNGNLSGSSFNVPGSTPVTVSGKIVYNTGAWSINLGGSTPYAGSMTFTEEYSQEVSGGSGSSSGTPGSSGVTIYAFNVQQEGNKLRIVDNNGSVYEGSFGSIRTTGGTDQDSSNASYNNGDEIIATFEASGESAAGISVQMTGNFQATISGVSSSTSGSSTTTRMTLSDRRILGTWIEDGGRTGEISGSAASVSTSTTDTTTTTTP